jgi:hypothetical protein
MSNYDKLVADAKALEQGLVKPAGQKLAATVQENLKQIELVENKDKARRESTDEEINRLTYKVYQPQIRALEAECQEKVDKVKGRWPPARRKSRSYTLRPSEPSVS